jgi:hypothetical protein
MAPRLFTFHKILSACEEGSREGWQVFLEGYTPIVFRLFDLYLPSSAQARKDFWRDALGDLTAHNFERLRGFEHQAEREFLVDLRAFLLDRGAVKLDPFEDSGLAPKPTPDTVGALLKGLPLIHQEVLFLKLGGYSDAAIEKALVITPSVAQEGLARLRPDYSMLLGRNEDRCLWPAAWGAVMRFARSAKKENCPPLRQFVRIQEGGFSWYEKEPAEQHIAGCLHCLECWTALREIKYWRNEAKPCAPSELDGLISALPVGPASKKKSLLARMFR